MGIETALLITAVAGGVMAAGGQIKQGMDTQKADLEQGRQMTEQAALERQSAGEKISTQDYEASQTLSRISANTGAAGVTSSGSPSDVANASAGEAKINDIFTRYSGNLAATKDIYAAEQLKYQGKQAEIAGFMGAGHTALDTLTGVLNARKGVGTKGTPQGGSLFNQS